MFWILSMVSGPECLTVVTLIIIWFFLLPFDPNDLNIICSTKSLLGEKKSRLTIFMVTLSLTPDLDNQFDHPFKFGITLMPRSRSKFIYTLVVMSLVKSSILFDCFIQCVLVYMLWWNVCNRHRHVNNGFVWQIAICNTTQVTYKSKVAHLKLRLILIILKIVIIQSHQMWFWEKPTLIPHLDSEVCEGHLSQQT